MSNTYTWTPTQLVGYPVLAPYTDVVTTAFYTVTADDGAGHTSEIQNIQQIPIPEERPFIPFDQLTPEIVTGWIQEALGENGVASIYANLDAQIEAQINPPPTPQVLPLPWVAPTDSATPTA